MKGAFPRRRIRAFLMALPLMAFLAVPAPLSTQVRTERERQEEAVRRIEERLQEMRALELARAEEMARRASERLAAIESELAVQQEARLARAEGEERALVQALEAQQERRVRAMEEALAAFEEAKAHQGRLMEDRERSLEEARSHYERSLSLEEGELDEFRKRAEEALARAEARLKEGQQVVVRVRARIRLGVRLDPGQGEEVDRQGARVMGVIDDSPAQEAGLEEGDIITHLNGHSLLDPLGDEAEEELEEDESLPVQRLIALAQELEEGDEVELRLLRDGQANTLSFQAAEVDEPNIWITGRDEGRGRIFGFGPEGRRAWTFTFPEDRVFSFDLPELDSLRLQEWEGIERLRDLEVHVPEFHFVGPGEGNLRAWTYRRGAETPLFLEMSGRHHSFGLEVRQLNPDLAGYFSTDRGILVLDVEADSELGLTPGDVIQAIGDREVEDTEDLWRILGSYEDGEMVTFVIMRRGEAMEVTGTIG